MTNLGNKVSRVTDSPILAGGTMVINVATGSSFVLITSGGTAALHSMYTVFRGSSARVYAAKIGGESGITVSQGTDGTITLTNTTGNGGYVSYIQLFGNIPTV